MIQNKRIEINESPLRVYIIRIALIFWIGFAAFKYELNPFFFGLTVLVAIILLAWLPIKKIFIANDTLYINKNRLLKFTNSEIEIPIYQLEEIKFEKGEWSLARFILDVFGHLAGSFGKAPSYIYYKEKNKNWVKMLAIGSPEDNENLVFIVEEIKRLNTRRFNTKV